jgi:hypothetical protein
MNKQIFEHLVKTNKQNRIKQSKEINHEEQQKFYNWLIENNLYKYLK